MKRYFLFSTLCITAIALAACGGSQTETQPAAPEAPVVDTGAIEEAAEEAADAIGEAVEEAADLTEEALDSVAETLEMDGPVPTGTAWQVGEYTLTFKEVDEVVDGTVHGKVQGTGGEIPAFLVNGMEFEYTLQPDGAIVITTPRGEFRGTYDGDALILDGNEATLLEQ